LFYVQALFYPLQGSVEWAARLPNFMASIVLVPLLGVLVWRWYRDEETAVLAALILALSPFAIQFSATAFTDPLMVMWLVAAMVVASPDNPKAAAGLQTVPYGGSVWRPATADKVVIAGFLFGLAIATKYQAWLFLPLLVGVGWLAGWRWRDWVKFAGGLLVVLLAVLLWDVARTGQFSLWGRQMGNFGGVRLSWSWEIWGRLRAWGQMWSYLGVSSVGVILMVLAVGLPLFKLGKDLLQRDKGTKEQRDLLDEMLALFLVGYGAVHWLLAVPVWDRYLLAVVPLVVVLMARLIVNCQLPIVNGQWRSRLLLVIVCLLLLVMLPAAWAGRNGRYPIGGSPEADGGAAEIAGYLYDAPYGTVLYDHWFSWQWGYHLFDRGVYVNWVPNPALLAEDLTVFGDGANVRFIVLPTDGTERPFIRKIEAVGFRLEPVPEAGGTSMTLYRIGKE
jgi:4-amino-4-deoxy-L-arabinose transferase-like glycosyltransferase